VLETDVQDLLRQDRRGGLIAVGDVAWDESAGAFSFEIERGAHAMAYDRPRPEPVDGLEFTVDAVDADTWRITATPTAERPPLGSFAHVLEFAFLRDGAALPHRVTRLVQGFRSGPITLWPREVLIGGLAPGADFQQRIEFDATGNASVRIEAAEAEHDLIALAIAEDGLVVRATGPEPQVASESEAGGRGWRQVVGRIAIVAHSAHHGRFELRLPYYAAVRVQLAEGDAED